ncbi:MAG: nuclear transport factor 2 family protein [Candidatus Neomarinimicrobiota bacterium]
MYKILVIMLLSNLTFGSDIDAIKNIINDNWEKTSQRKVGDFIHPEGSWLATSEGSFWNFQSPKENRNRIESSLNTLNFTPYHINIEILGAKKDIAYVVYYLGGTIDRNDKVLVSNYRTRASNVMKKEKGKWYTVGAHYSPMHSGAGVTFD